MEFGIGHHMLTAFAAEMDTGMDVIGNLSYGGSMRENTGQMNESEQAQTITQIRENHKFAMREKRNNREMTQAQADRGVLLKIVDSQSQKIAQLTKERDAMTATAYRLGSEAQQHISEGLLAIIDDLQARAPRQYTEQELQEWFDNRPLVQDEIDALLHEVVPGENEAWYSVLKFAAHVGALKAEP